MIVKELHIDGFGIFQGTSLTGLSNGVNIILGSNEAGKSTLMAFLRYTLFGYPDARTRTNQFPPLQGGNHGGRIIGVTSQGKEVVFERYAGTRDGKIRLAIEGHESQNTADWMQLLGNANKELFNNVYSFSLDELVGVDSLTQSGVEDRIFSLGMGLGGISIREVEAEISKKSDAIYLPRGRTQIIPEINKELQEQKQRVAEIQGHLPRYRELAAEIACLSENLETRKSQIRDMEDKKRSIDNFLKCYDYYLIYSRSQEALASQPQVRDYPGNGEELLDKLEERETDMLNAIRDLKEGTAGEKGTEELEKAAKSVSYNADILEYADGIGYLRENLEKYKQTLREKGEEERAQGELQQEIDAGIRDISGTWNEQTVSGFSDTTAHRDRLQQFKAAFEQLDEKERELETREKVIAEKVRLLNARAMAAVISIAFLIASVPAFIYGLPVWGAALLLVAILIFFSPSFIISKDPHDRLSDQRKEIQKSRTSLETGFGSYLNNHMMLQTSVTADGALKILDQVEKLRSTIRERNRVTEKLTKNRIPFVLEFEETAAGLQNALTRAVDTGNTEILVRRILEEFEESMDLLNQKRKLEEECTQRQRQIEKYTARLADIRKEIAALLRSAGTQEREQFRKIIKGNNQARENLHRQKEAIGAIERIAGRNNADAVIAFLTEQEKPAVERRSQELSEEIASRRKEAEEEQQKLGGLENQIDQLAGESELSDAMTALETSREKLRNAYKDWLVAKTALHILGKVKATYERERQPEVIQRSGKYFRTITAGAYDRIRVSLEEKEIALFDSAGATKNISQLSRGTKEQLLTSIRLGFIEQYEQQAEPLPVIVDEVMVNYDPERARLAAEVLSRFAASRQVLYFTCHPGTIDQFPKNAVLLKHL